jgi:hypothetical protein
MKTIAALVLVTTLSGCAVIDKVTQFWPRDHDSAMVSAYVNLETQMEKASCSDSKSYQEAFVTADWIRRYAEFRNDPQLQAAKNVSDNLKKATEASEAACKRRINLTNINMKLIKESWSAR